MSGRLDLAGLGLVADVRPTKVGLNPIDEQWLSVAAVVRPPLARLEACQLERLVETGRGFFYAWTNRPGDPWQLNVPVNPDTGLRPDSALLVAYRPAEVLDGTPGVRSVILLDGWTETVPSTEQATCAGFGFNALGARAPQAVLVAVPPRSDGELDKDALIRILTETRELAHARMAGADELGAFAGAVPTLMLPAVGDTGVELLPSFFFKPK